MASCSTAVGTRYDNIIKTSRESRLSARNRRYETISRYRRRLTGNGVKDLHVFPTASERCVFRSASGPIVSRDRVKSLPYKPVDGVRL